MRLAASLIFVSAVLAVTPNAFADSFKFRAELSGDQEVPPPGVATSATGSIRLNFDAGLTEVAFDLRVHNGAGITQAHLHCARAGRNGPVVAFLFGLVSPGIDVDGRLAKGVLTNDDIVPQDCGAGDEDGDKDDDKDKDVDGGKPVNNIASLLAAIRDGLIYVNVHSEAYPPGEIRGQIFSKSDDDDKDGDKDSDKDGDKDSDKDGDKDSDKDVD